MSCTNLDLTIESVLADPMVAAIMRADRIDRRGFESMLRLKARHLDETRSVKSPPFGLLAHSVCNAMKASTPRW